MNSTTPRPAWPTNAFYDLTQIEVEARDLSHLADAFAATGNEVVAMRLYEMARELRHRSENLRNEITNAVTQRLKDAQESTGTLLSAILATEGQMLRRSEQENPS